MKLSSLWWWKLWWAVVNAIKGRLWHELWIELMVYMQQLRDRSYTASWWEFSWWQKKGNVGFPNGAKGKMKKRQPRKRWCFPSEKIGGLWGGGRVSTCWFLAEQTRQLGNRLRQTAPFRTMVNFYEALPSATMLTFHDPDLPIQMLIDPTNLEVNTSRFWWVVYEWAQRWAWPYVSAKTFQDGKKRLTQHKYTREYAIVFLE